MSAAAIRQDVSTMFSQIRYLRCTEKIHGYLVAIAGLLISLWTNCILIVICIQDNYMYESHELFIQKTIIHSSQLTHLLIVITCTIGLILGLKEKIPSYLSPWLVIKILELIILFIGIIALATSGRRAYIGLMPLAICFLMIGGYISLCVWDSYKKMGEDTTSSFENVSLNMPDTSVHVMPDKPPSYDSFTNQTHHT